MNIRIALTIFGTSLAAVAASFVATSIAWPLRAIALSITVLGVIVQTVASELRGYQPSSLRRSNPKNVDSSGDWRRLPDPPTTSSILGAEFGGLLIAIAGSIAVAVTLETVGLDFGPLPEYMITHLEGDPNLEGNPRLIRVSPLLLIPLVGTCSLFVNTISGSLLASYVRPRGGLQFIFSQRREATRPRFVAMSTGMTLTIAASLSSVLLLEDWRWGVFIAVNLAMAVAAGLVPIFLIAPVEFSDRKRKVHWWFL